MYLKSTVADHEGPQAGLESLRYSIAEEARRRKFPHRPVPVIE